MATTTGITTNCNNCSPQIQSRPRAWPECGCFTKILRGFFRWPKGGTFCLTREHIAAVKKRLPCSFPWDRQLGHYSMDLIKHPELSNTKHSESCWNQWVFYSVPSVFLSALRLYSLYLCQWHWTAETCYSHFFFFLFFSFGKLLQYSPFAMSKIISALNPFPLCPSSTVHILCKAYRFLYNKSILETGGSQIKRVLCCGDYCSRTKTLHSDDGLHLMQLSKTYGLIPAINAGRFHIQLQQCVFLSWWKVLKAKA